MASSAPKSPGNRLKIGFILSRAFTLSAFSLFVDTLRLASDETDRSTRRDADWQVLSSTRNLISSSCGVQVAPTSGLVAPSEFDYIVVVGGLLNCEKPIDYETVSYLRRAADCNVPLIGLCTGTFILAEAGLMKHHRNCVSWLHYNAFRERFPDHHVMADRIYNLDRKRGSCAGGGSAADMAASIVRRHIGRAAERNALEVLQIDRARQAQDIQPRRPLAIEADDQRIRAVMLLMEQNIEEKLSIGDMASAVGLSRRQLERIFLDATRSTPVEVYRRIRLDRARQLLLKTRAPLVDIASEVGFTNTSHFTRLFRAAYGQTPTALRNTNTAALPKHMPLSST